ncbi:MAG: hypothetical protein Q4D38_01015 [Planctomycetia bacterium]|nr:hypothetical protein [Planctomycetia bacterium]
MNKYNQMFRFTNALLAIMPESIELQWDRTILLERMADVALMEGNIPEALNLFQESISLKEKMFETANQKKEMRNSRSWDERRIAFAKSCTCFARICRSRRLFHEAAATLQKIIVVLKMDEFYEEKKQAEQLLQDSYQILDEILSWENWSQSSDQKKNKP